MDGMARVGSRRRGDDRPPPIRSDLGRMALFGPVGRGIDRFVIGLGRADPVEPQRLVVGQLLERLSGFGRRKARIEEAFVPHPGQCGEFGPLDPIGQGLARAHIQHLEHTPVAAAVLHAVKQIAAILRWLPGIERGGAIGRPGVGIEQQPRCTLQSLPDKQLRLILQAGIAHVEIAPPGTAGQAETFIIGQLADPASKPGALRQPRQIGPGHRVLPRHPVSHGGIVAHIGFQPAIGIGHGFTELRFNQRVAAGGGIRGGQRGRSGHVISGLGRQRSERQQQPQGKRGMQTKRHSGGPPWRATVCSDRTIGAAAAKRNRTNGPAGTTRSKKGGCVAATALR